MPDSAQADLIGTARDLLSGRFQGTLSTHSATQQGYPFGSVTPFCLDHDGLPLLLLSHLAQHSRNLAENPRCCLLICDDDGAGDPQQQARLSAMADSEPLVADDTDSVDRYFRYFPHTQPYFEQLNFRFFRLRPKALHLNAGFAAARWVGFDRIDTGRLSADVEAMLIERLNSHPDSLTKLSIATVAESTIAGIDRYGVDRRSEKGPYRSEFAKPFESPEQLVDQLAKQH